MSGNEIKDMIINAGLKLWQVAEEYGYTDSTFSKKLRHPFSDTETERVIEIIEKLKSH